MRFSGGKESQGNCDRCIALGVQMLLATLKYDILI